MKITKSHLKQIIKEELSRVMREDDTVPTFFVLNKDFTAAYEAMGSNHPFVQSLTAFTDLSGQAGIRKGKSRDIHIGKLKEPNFNLTLTLYDGPDDDQGYFRQDLSDEEIRKTLEVDAENQPFFLRVPR